MSNLSFIVCIAFKLLVLVLNAHDIFVAGRMSLVEQQMLPLPEHLSSPWFLVWIVLLNLKCCVDHFFFDHVIAVHCFWLFLWYLQIFVSATKNKTKWINNEGIITFTILPVNYWTLKIIIMNFNMVSIKLQIKLEMFQIIEAIDPVKVNSDIKNWLSRSFNSPIYWNLIGYNEFQL